MDDVYTLSPGDGPLLISIPHDGRKLAPGMRERMTEEGLALPDTDWHVRRLYGFAGGLGATVISADYSRYVVDLNRPATDEALYAGQVSTGLCPSRTFAGQPIYRDGQGLTSSERKARLQDYWMPYHEALAAELARLRERFGYALLWDAHSIAAEVPALFAGQLPDLNVGTDDGASCDGTLQAAIWTVAAASEYSSVLNGRFKGGYITRHYGRPGDAVHAIQLEVSQRCYMDGYTTRYQADSASRLGKMLREMLTAFIDTAAAL